jgi:molecular chaperone DnaK
VRSLIDREANQNVNPDEVVAVGAAIQAGILAGDVKDILLLDVTPLSLGLETVGGVMKKLIPRNTTIPVRRSDIFSTGEDNQTLVEVHVLQGERDIAAGNKSIGRFKLTGIPPAPRGLPQIQVSFDIDANGILQVAAMERTTGREQSITVQDASTLGEEEVKRMMREAQEYADVDRQKKEKVEKRNQAESQILQAERQLREATLDFGMQFVSGYRSKIERSIQSLREALGQNDDRGIDRAKADLDDALYDLRREVYQRNKEEEESDSLFGAIKSFFTDDDDDYYDDDRRDYDPYRTGGGGSYGGGYSSGGSYGSGRSTYGMGSGGARDENRYGGGRNDYGAGSGSWNDSRYSGQDAGTGATRGDSRYNNGRDADNNTSWDEPRPKERPRYDDERGYDSGRSRDAGRPRNESRPPYPEVGGASRGEPRPPSDARTTDRDRPTDRDRTDRRPSRPPKNARPNLYQDNWDDEDEWL